MNAQYYLTSCVLSDYFLVFVMGTDFSYIFLQIFWEEAALYKDFFKFFNLK